MRPIYLTIFIILITLLSSVVSVLASNPLQEATPPPVIPIPTVPDLSGEVADNIRAIYTVGREKGNRADVFVKVGDSSTQSNNFLTPIGEGYYDLGEFGYLQGIIDTYSATPIRTGNSFNNTSVAAGVGWSAASLTNSAYGAAGLCESGEGPLRCEYRVNKPAIALIMVGTNEVSYLSVEDYLINMQRVVDTSVEMGVIPVISTIPLRRGNDEKVAAYNAALVEFAAANRIPLWDYAAIMNQLPNFGMTRDLIHPSAPPGNWREGATTFTPENLPYGFTMRNLTALQMLLAVWNQLPQ